MSLPARFYSGLPFRSCLRMIGKHSRQPSGQIGMSALNEPESFGYSALCIWSSSMYPKPYTRESVLCRLFPSMANGRQSSLMNAGICLLFKNIRSDSNLGGDSMKFVLIADDLTGAN